jgi:hypothetical protein
MAANGMPILRGMSAYPGDIISFVETATDFTLFSNFFPEHDH